jgi:RHS repeat-associated protein
VAISSTQTPPCSVAAYNPPANNGNVYRITNNRSSTRTQSFTYDSLNRILSGQSGGSGGTSWGDTYVIDAWGNLTNINPISGKGYGQNFQAAPASVQNQLSGYCNDAAGNLILNILCPQNPIPTYVYDAENRLVWTSGYRYIYDGDGQRVEKCQAATATTACPTSGTTGTLYWRGTGSDTLAETDLGGSQQEEYIFFNGQRIARRDVSSTGATIGLHYYFSDHLGSHGVVETLTTSGTASCDQDIDYYPYGGVESDYCPNVAQNYKFTGKERDTESGLDYFGARFDASSVGRFATPDLFANDTHPSDPQSWILYTYVRNNPLRYVDPDGEKVYVGGVTGGDLDELLRRINATYGCSGCVTVGDDGYLAVNTSGLSADVQKATANLTGAINSTDWFAEVRVSNNDSNVAFGQTRANQGAVPWGGVRRNADLIVLDLADNRQVQGDKLAAETFTNTVLAHEILHRFPNPISDPEGGAAYRIGGPVVDAVNGITSALGLPSRATYSTRPLIPGTSAETYVSRDQGTGKEQTRIIFWQRNIVGGKD